MSTPIPSLAPRIIVAGTGFKVIREHLAAELQPLHLEMIEVDELRVHGAAAEILLPCMARIDGALMDRIAGLRLIQQWGAGLEGVDIEAATARRIAVANVPTAGTGNAESVAEWCVMAAIAISRRLSLAVRNIERGGGWGEPAGRALLGRTAGIVGLGGIGQALAARLRPFGMHLIAIQRRPDQELAARLGLEWIGAPEQLAELLRRSDYLFLCIPQTPQTRGLIDAAALALLPDQACIINAARGGLLDAGAMLRALDSGRLLGVATDVFAGEPLDPASPLLRRADVLATPHIAGVTDVSYRGIARAVADNIRRLCAGLTLCNCVNPSSRAA